MSALTTEALVARMNQLAGTVPVELPLDHVTTPAEVADALNRDAKPEPVNPILQAALRCVELGWFVFALRERDKQPDSKLAPHGFNSSTNDPDVVRSWFANKNPNYGIDLGRSNLTVLDFDKEKPAGLELPDTLQVSTSRGVHVYFQGVSKQGDLHVGGQHVGEIKSAGGYVLGPGCIHPDGPIYSVVLRAPLAPVPPLESFRTTDGKAKVTPRNERGLIPHGSIHPWMLMKAGQGRQLGMEFDELESWLLRQVHENCEPPIDDEKVSAMARSVCGLYEPGQDYLLVLNQSATQPPQQPVDVSNWQSLFRSIGEMEDGPIDMIIEGALQEGTCFIGANPGDGKTLVALAFAKAICTGTPLFGLPMFTVKKARPVIYLIPESRDRAFRKRCEAFKLPDDKSKFMARTISAGVPLDLADPRLLEAVRQTKAVVFLDTASRFMKSGDENAAAQNRFLVNDVVALLAAGAVCVVLVHHATKASKTSGERMTLENMLRGTGDFGAMCDQAYGIRKDMTLYANGDGPMEIELVSLKDREQIGGLTSLRLAASHKPPSRTTREDGAIEERITFVTSYIDTTGNFKIVSDTETAKREVQALEALVKNEPSISAKEIASRLDISDYRVKSQLEKLGYHRAPGGPTGASPWHKDVNGVCPFEKTDEVEVKPVKKTFNLSVTEAAKKLEAYLAEAGPVTTQNVNKWADKHDITDTVLGKARKRVNVVEDKENGTWDLPAGDPARAF